MAKVVQGLFALVMALFLSSQLPSPVFDVCLYGDSINRSWYYCQGGYKYAFGFVFALCLFAIGPRLRTYYAITFIVLLVVVPIDSLRHGAPIQEAILTEETIQVFLGAIAGTMIGVLMSYCFTAIREKSFAT